MSVVQLFCLALLGTTRPGTANPEAVARGSNTHHYIIKSISNKTAAIDHGMRLYKSQPVGHTLETLRPLHRSSPHFFGLGPFVDAFGVGALGVGVGLAVGVGLGVAVLGVGLVLEFFACRMRMC